MKHPVPMALLALSLAVPAAAAAAAEIACPRASGGKPLRPVGGASLFEGDRAENAELAPDRSTGTSRSYTNIWRLERSQALTLVCRYQGGGEVVRRLPAGLSVCRQTPSAFTCG